MRNSRTQDTEPAVVALTTAWKTYTTISTHLLAMGVIWCVYQLNSRRASIFSLTVCAAAIRPLFLIRPYLLATSCVSTPICTECTFITHRKCVAISTDSLLSGKLCIINRVSLPSRQIPLVHSQIGPGCQRISILVSSKICDVFME